MATKTGISERIKQDSKQKIENTKRSAADQIDQVAQALTRAGEELNQSQPTIANYASQFASSVSNFATRLREGNMDELISDTRELARRNPGLFLAGGVALGFALSRFLKASAEHEEMERYSSEYGTEDYGTGTGYADTAATMQRGQDTMSDVESSSYASGTSGTRTRDEFSASRDGG
jgi:hypothetical protein